MKIRNQIKKEMKNVKKVISTLLIAVFGGLVALGLFKAFEPGNHPVNEESVNAQLAGYEIRQVNIPNFDFVEVAELSTPTVVHITTKVNRQRSERSEEEERPRSPFDFFERFDDFNQRPRQGSGSGVIISDNGYIVTNNHVIDRSDEIEVTLFDKRTFRADVVGTDPNTDLALLKIEADNLSPLGFGNSDNLRIGEWVLAVGNPFNLTSTVTAGIVSAKGRNINLLGGGAAIESFIQTDAAVNPGNSGGALINTSGELIGINTAIATQTGQYSGYSFAIPVNIVRKVVDDIMEFGEVQRGFIGVNIRNVNSEIAKEKGLERVAGVLVEDLMEGGAASDAGIKSSDVIIAVDDKDVNTVAQLQEMVSLYRPGDEVTVRVIRNGKEREFDVILRNRDGTTAFVSSERDQIRKLLGAEFEVIREADREKLEVSHGVRVRKLNDGKLKAAGVPEGFIITRIDNKNIYTTADIFRVFSNKTGGVLVEGLNPDGSKGFYGFGIGS